MACIFGSRTNFTDPTLPAAKCASYKNYAKCAAANSCPNMLQSWCTTTFTTVPGCVIPEVCTWNDTFMCAVRA